MEKDYKYEAYIPEYYNITTKLIDEKVNSGLQNRIAVQYQDQIYTYQQIQQLTNKVGNALHILGVRMEQRVMLLMYDSPEALACFYGAIKIGAIPIPVNYMYTSDDFRFLLNNSRATTLILHEDFVDVVEEWRNKFLYLINTIVVGKKTRAFQIAFHDIVDRASDKLDVAYTTIEDAAFWNFTSGSTGVPKAAVHLQHDVFTCTENYGKGVLGINDKDILFSASKFFFAYGLGNSIFYPFAFNASVVLVPERPHPETIFDTISRYRPTIFFGVPTLYANMLQVKNIDNKYNLSSLRICVSAGEALPKEIFYEWKAKFGVEILDGIGSTELLHIFISNRPGEAKPGSLVKLFLVI